MRKIVFIVTGYQQKVSHSEFKWMRPYFSRMGYEVRVFAPHWERRVMTDYVAEFTDFYYQHKGTHNTVLGFSFGAMIALISAPIL